MTKADALAFIVGAFMLTLFVEFVMLFASGGTELILFIIGFYWTIHVVSKIPKIPGRYREWQRVRDELRLFRVEIEEHDKEH